MSAFVVSVHRNNRELAEMKKLYHSGWDDCRYCFLKSSQASSVFITVPSGMVAPTRDLACTNCSIKNRPDPERKTVRSRLPARNRWSVSGEAYSASLALVRISRPSDRWWCGLL